MRRVLVVLLITLVATSAFAAGDAYVAKNETYGPHRQIVWDWESDASGNVNTVGYAYIQGGSVFSFSHVPISGVSDNYDVQIGASFVIVLEDETTRTVTFADILGGQGTDLSNSTNGDNVVLSKPFNLPHGTKLELKITNAGNTQSGTFILDIWEERFLEERHG